jgi:UDP-3-O-[3-hydroxymyristoyl] glucosamine N-acyltransferase
MANSAVAAKLTELVKRFGGEIVGDDVEVTSIASLDSAEFGDLSFYTATKYSDKVASCKASALVVKQFNAKYPCTQVVVKDPQLFVSRSLNVLFPRRKSCESRHPTCVIHNSADIDSSAEIGAYVVVESGSFVGPGTIIESGTVIGENVTIGSNCRIHPRVVIYSDCVIGDSTEIHSGAVIGSDGFGNAWNGKSWEKIQQIGKVIIGSNVEIGANTTIDRGALDDTIISDGVRLDNLIQIAHNVKIGAHTAMAGCAGVAGSTTIGANCLIGGGVLIAGHIEIANGITLLSGSGTPNSLTEPGVYASGVPTMPYSTWARNSMHYRRLDEMAKRIRKIEKNSVLSGMKQQGEENGTD